MKCSNFQYSNHAVLHMFKRSISADEVEEVITHGEMIKIILMTSHIRVF